MNVIIPEEVDAYLSERAPGTVYGVRVIDDRTPKFFRYALRDILLNRRENLQELTDLPADAPQWLQRKWPEGGPYFRFAPNQALDEQVQHISEWIAAAITDREPWIDQCDVRGNPHKLAQLKTLGEAMNAANESMRLRNERLAKQYANVFANEEIVAKFDKDGHIHLPDEEGYAALEAPYNMVRLRTGDELNLESIKMGHCIGREGYHERLTTGQCQYFSLRDKKNNAHATFEVTAGKKLLQCRGAQNEPPVAKYRPMIQAFVRQQRMRFEGLDFDTGLIGTPNGLYYDVYNLPPYFTYNGDLDFTYQHENKLKTLPITFLPEGLHVLGSLILSNTPIKKLPDNLTVDDHLKLDGSKVTELPKNLRVGRSIDIRNTGIKTVPDDTTAGGTIFGLPTPPVTQRPVEAAPRRPEPVPIRPEPVQPVPERVEAMRRQLADRRAERINMLRERLANAQPVGWVQKVTLQGLVNEEDALARAGAGRMR